MGRKTDIKVIFSDLDNTISPSGTAAFGDGTNDIPMLDAAGIAAAVEDAPDEVKKHADHIVAGHKNDGPALFIEQNFL